MTDNALTKTDTARPWASAPVDVWESDQDYLLRLDVPGVSQEKLSLTFERGRLVISGTRVEHGSTIDVRRSFALNGDVDAENVKAELSNGVLTVRVPKTEEQRPRQIPVHVS